MTPEALSLRLSEERIVVLSLAEWEDVSAAFPEVERHPTYIAGELVVVRDHLGPLAVEQPDPGRRVLRRLADDQDVRRFVQDRLDTYERMWDGCGCKVEYFR